MNQGLVLAAAWLEFAALLALLLWFVARPRRG
jgi:hypothetical protein